MNGIELLPERASNFAEEMDWLYFTLTGLTILFCLIVFGSVLYLMVKYRAGSRVDRSNPPHGNLKLEIAWSVIPLLMGVPVFIWASKLFVDMYTPIPTESALPIYVVGKQWMWHLQHPTGHRENNELHIPVGKPVKLIMISQDVIHAFFVPAFRIKRDVIPGRYQTAWFIATKPGKYRLFCAEYCGSKHSEMTGWVYAMKPADYEKWLKEVRWGMGAGQRPETMAEMGEKLFHVKGCDSCHKPDGKQAPNLIGIFGKQRPLADGRMVIADEAYIRRSIYDPEVQRVAGYKAIMPTYVGRLDEQEVLRLIAYIKSLSIKPMENRQPQKEKTND
ncbi:MAG TPA: cytochrome c oxidase subunit II [Fimbriimonadales bacterium]|nr:cytochrome c oxidase subunit II [Fimbriimonadales bacterium]